MNKFKKVNALTAAIILTIIVILACSVLLILHDEFGLLFGERNNNVEYTIEFSVHHDGYVSFEKGQHLYLSQSRESFGWVDNVRYEDNGTMVVSITATGLNKDGSVMVNGNTYIAKDTELSIMNNEINIKILNISVN